MTHLFNWEEILGQINLFQKKLQEPDIGLDVCVTHMDATKIFFNRNTNLQVSVNQSKTKCEEMEISVEKQIRRKRKLPGEKEDDIRQTLFQEIKRNLYECHDRLVNKLKAQFNFVSHLQIFFAGLSSQAILEDTKSEFERKFKILGNISTWPLQVTRLRGF